MRSNSLALILFVGLALAACQKRVPIAPLPPPTPVAAPAPVSAVDLAHRAFASGSYEEAGRGYENFLKNGPPQENARRHEALFYLALTYALRPVPATDWQRASTIFKQLVDEYPDSSFRSQAELMLALRSEVDQAVGEVRQRDQRLKQLTTELDRLKKIDADRRKRP